MKIYDGNESSFNLDSVELSLNKSELVRNPINSEFKLRVLEKVLEIPRGEVRTYKEVAESLNSRAWRAVGNALAKNPLPLIIPCHRVVKSDLSLGNYVGGVEMKKRLLKKEGVKINSLRIIRP
ncbi:MAG: MGMT family protein [Methanobacteriaceae archaeon]|nr:MGMT family protein [Methanobacteriaceae archaeon]